MIFRKFNLTLIFLLFLFALLGCKTKINQVKNNLQEGKWVTVDTFDYPYITKGKYRKGVAIGNWKYFYNGKLERKEKFKKNKCLTIFYYPNGKVKQQGYTKLDNIDNKAHWYYTDDWRYFDKNGKLTRIYTFQEGKIIDSIIVKSP